jgi:hypothetical protein
MSSDLSRRPTSVPVPRGTRAALGTIVNEARLQQAATRALTTVGENAMFEVAQLKRTQRDLEQTFPEASEALNLIANCTAMAIARSVNNFGSGLTG